jgi:hypothetical protein
MAFEHLKSNYRRKKLRYISKVVSFSGIFFKKKGSFDHYINEVTFKNIDFVKMEEYSKFET